MLPNQSQIFNALQTLFAYAAGIAVAHGFLTENTATQLVGGIAVLAPLVWGMISQTAANKVLGAATVKGVSVKVGPTADPSITAIAGDPAQPKVTPGG
jgi:hypothetical protein